MAAPKPVNPALPKPNYSFEKRQRELAKKKQQEEKQARKKEAREATNGGKPTPSEPVSPGEDGQD